MSSPLENKVPNSIFEINFELKYYLLIILDYVQLTIRCYSCCRHCLILLQILQNPIVIITCSRVNTAIVAASTKTSQTTQHPLIANKNHQWTTTVSLTCILISARFTSTYTYCWINTVFLNTLRIS